MTVAGEIESGWVHELQLPIAVETLLVFLIFDFWRYWEHRVFHEVPLLWRVHLVHHSDTYVDITTSERHHPFEALIASFTALFLVFALGFSAQAFAIYLAIATLFVLFSHANIVLSEGLDKSLRFLVVTPAVHAVHHSDYPAETNSNYGTVLMIWDRLFGTYVDPTHAKIPHFGLEYFHQRRDTTLASALLQPFEYRKGIVYPDRIAEAGPGATGSVLSTIALSAEWRSALWRLTLCLGLVLIAFWPTAANLAALWANSEPYQYAWLVLPMFVYVLVWYHRDRVLALTPRPDYMGLPVVLISCIMWSASYIVDIQLGQHVAMVLAIQGIALSALGRVTYFRLLPIMAMLFLMIPSGDILQPALRGLTVKWIEWFALLFNIPHSIEGFVAYIGGHRYVVIDACSGLTFVTLGGFLGYSFGVLVFRSLHKVLALAAAGALLGVITNAMRVWLIIGIDWLRGSQMSMGGHMDMQWLALVVSLGLLFYFTNKMTHESEPEKKASVSSAGINMLGAARFAPVTAALFVLVIVGSVQGLGNGTVANANAIGALNFLAQQYPESHWIDDAGPGSRSLSIPYKRQMDAILVIPEAGRGRLNEASLDPRNKTIWRHASTSLYLDCLAKECVNFVHKTWKQKDSNNTRHTFFTYIVGDTQTRSKLTYRLANGWSRIAGLTEFTGIIGFNIRGETPAQKVLAAAFYQFKENLSVEKNGKSMADIKRRKSTDLTGI